MEQRKHVAIFSGGNSGEHQISINSAKLILSHIDQQRFCPWLVVVRGEEWLCDVHGSWVPVDRNDMTILVEGDEIRFDVVYMMIHGTPGEDGMLQGYFDLMGIPYTSSNRLTSALTFNKFFCSRYVSLANCVNTADALMIRRGGRVNPEEILELSGLPCFVKPNNGGSSVGMSKVKRAEELIPAIEKAFQEDEEVLVEAFIKGTEITCGVFSMEGNLVVLPLTEIVPKTEYFDFEAKYRGASEEITPARISAADEQEIKRVSALLFRHLHCQGVVRFDYILSEQGLFFLEVNTVPGMSAESIVPQMLAHHGMSLTDFITNLIEESKSRE
jgi:D-alanine-D-alanine ligase